jgi:hypothetical protein
VNTLEEALEQVGAVLAYLTAKAEKADTPGALWGTVRERIAGDAFYYTNRVYVVKREEIKCGDHMSLSTHTAHERKIFE